MLTMRTYDAPEYDEMHTALDAHELARYFDIAEAFDGRIDAISREVYALALDYGCVMVDTNGLGINDNAYTRCQYRQYLHRSARYPGCLQLTSWDDLGPICDVRIADCDDLAQELRHSMRGTMWCMYDEAA